MHWLSFSKKPDSGRPAGRAPSIFAPPWRKIPNSIKEDLFLFITFFNALCSPYPKSFHSLKVLTLGSLLFISINPVILFPCIFAKKLHYILLLQLPTTIILLKNKLLFLCILFITHIHKINTFYNQLCKNHTMTDLNKFQFKTEPILLKKDRSFSGIAYSGEVIQHGYWGAVIFDLASTTADSITPMLLEHDRDKRVGFTESVIIDNKIRVAGKMLSNKDATEMISDADEGFPFQQSVHIEPTVTREVPANTTEIINGNEVIGGVTVFENSIIREISFTPTGVDANTPTKIFSINKQQEGKKMADSKDEELKELKASLELERVRADTAESALATMKKDQRQFAIDAIGKEFDEADTKLLHSLDAASFKLFASQIEAKKDPDPVPAINLFSADLPTKQEQPAVNPMFAAAQNLAGVK